MADSKVIAKARECVEDSLAMLGKISLAFSSPLRFLSDPLVKGSAFQRDNCWPVTDAVKESQLSFAAVFPYYR